jgi:hypothetical protein
MAIYYSRISKSVNKVPGIIGLTNDNFGVSVR